MNFDQKSLKSNLCAVINTTMKFVNKFQLMRPFELAILITVCFLSGRLLSYLVGWGNPVFSGFWVIIMALLVNKDSPDIKLIDLIQSRFPAVGLGVIAAFVVLQVFGVNFFGLLAAVLLVAWLCEFFHWQDYQPLALMSLSVLVVSDYLNVDNNIPLWASAIGRILEAGVGILLAFGLHLIFTNYCFDLCSNSKENN